MGGGRQREWLKCPTHTHYNMVWMRKMLLWLKVFLEKTTTQYSWPRDIERKSAYIIANQDINKVISLAKCLFFCVVGN